jgi:hypothetical protein
LFAPPSSSKSLGLLLALPLLLNFTLLRLQDSVDVQSKQNKMEYQHPNHSRSSHHQQPSQSHPRPQSQRTTQSRRSSVASRQSQLIKKAAGQSHLVRSPGEEREAEEGRGRPNSGRGTRRVQRDHGGVRGRYRELIEVAGVSAELYGVDETTAVPMTAGGERDSSSLSVDKQSTSAHSPPSLTPTDLVPLIRPSRAPSLRHPHRALLRLETPRQEPHHLL